MERSVGLVYVGEQEENPVATGGLKRIGSDTLAQLAASYNYILYIKVYYQCKLHSLHSDFQWQSKLSFFLLCLCLNLVYLFSLRKERSKKFMYCKKATKLKKNLPLNFDITQKSQKQNGRFFFIFVAFSEYLSFPYGKMNLQQSIYMCFFGSRC